MLTHTDVFLVSHCLWHEWLNNIRAKYNRGNNGVEKGVENIGKPARKKAEEISDKEKKCI